MRFYVVDCSTKQEVLSDILENQKIAWNPSWTIGFDPEEAGITSVDFTINGTLKHTEGKLPYHANGDFIPIKLAEGPISCTAVLWKSGKRYKSVTRHFVSGPDVAVRDCSFGAICSGTSVPMLMYKQIPNVTAVRLWHDIPDDWSLPSRKQFEQYSDLVKGMKSVVLCCTTPQVPSYQQAMAWYTALADILSHLFGGTSVLSVEVGNEPNLKSYFSGGVDDYMNKVLQPASEALRNRSIRVVGGAPSEDTNYLKSMVSRGYLSMCDVAAYHPYGRSVSTHISRSKMARDIVGGKPLWLTEWNAHLNLGGMSLEEWAESIPKMAAGINSIVDVAFYYRMIRKQKLAGWAGLFDPGTYKPTEFLPEFQKLR